jgi:hypothetical protein
MQKTGNHPPAAGKKSADESVAAKIREKDGLMREYRDSMGID